MKFCSTCGSSVSLLVPAGDTHKRHVCNSCDEIHYRNPKIVAGAIVEWEDRILLCKRAIEPRYGYWTLPAGYMELGETTAQAAVRETLEEACARVSIGGLQAIANIPRIGQVYMIFYATLQDLNFRPGQESLEVQLFSEAEVPWDDLAFPAIEQSMRRYFQDRRAGLRDMHLFDVHRRPGA